MQLTRRLLSVSALLVLALGLAGCSDTSSTSSESTPPTASAGATSEVKPYPLNVCIVSDEELGSMGDPIVFVNDGQEIKVCCDDCKAPFEKDPAKYLAKLKP